MTDFPSDYAEARTRFRAAAHAAGWTCEACPTADTGPQGEPLFVDVASSARAGPGPVLIVSSGLHGVEGAFGSAVQTALLNRCSAGRLRFSPPLRCVLVHALDPYGFAWSRRTDGLNVDLNRGFRSAGMPPPIASTSYARLDRLLNPPSPPKRIDGFRIRMLAAALAHGRPALRQAIASGQDTHPRGLFFAGRTRTPLQALLEGRLPAWIGAASSVVHLDLHTGLGRWARPQLIVDYPLSPTAREWMTQAFGPGLVVEPTRDTTGYVARGSLGHWCVQQKLADPYHFAFAEFGTYGNIAVLAGLRAENQAHFWTAFHDPRARRARARLRELFCPTSPRWRARTVAIALTLVDRAARALGAGVSATDVS